MRPNGSITTRANEISRSEERERDKERAREGAIVNKVLISLTFVYAEPQSVHR